MSFVSLQHIHALNILLVQNHKSLSGIFRPPSHQRGWVDLHSTTPFFFYWKIGTNWKGASRITSRERRIWYHKWWKHSVAELASDQVSRHHWSRVVVHRKDSENGGWRMKMSYWAFFFNCDFGPFVVIWTLFYWGKNKGKIT